MTSAHAMGAAEIMDRCNLTVLLEPGQEDLPGEGPRGASRGGDAYEG